LIRERQREGIKAAQAAGKQIGAKPKLDRAQIRAIRKRVKSGEIKAALAREYGVSRQTLYKALN
jgi:DNA invertase Pin-like site-specific DNA recombinase